MIEYLLNTFNYISKLLYLNIVFSIITNLLVQKLNLLIFYVWLKK